MTSKVTYNQTAFATDEPVYDAFGENTKLPETPDSQTKKSARWKTYGIVFGVLLFTLSLLILLFSLQSGPKEEVSVAPSPTPVPQQIIGPNQQRLLELKQAHEAADPAAQDLFFPPVNMKLRLDSEL